MNRGEGLVYVLQKIATEISLYYIILAAINTPRCTKAAKIAICDLKIVNHCPSHANKIAPNLHFEEATCISVNQSGSLSRTTTKAFGTNFKRSDPVCVTISRSVV